MTAVASRWSEQLGRYAVVHHPEGPRIRFGVGWVALLGLGLLAGSFAVALLFAVAAAAAGLQLSGAWRRAGAQVNPAVAGAGAGVLPLAAWWNNRAVGAAVLLLVAVAVGLGPDPAALLARRRGAGNSGDDGEPGPGPVSVPDRLTAAGVTLRCAFFVGLALAAAVQIQRVTTTALLFVVVALSVYDAGHFLCGVDARNRVVGPVAGAVGVLVWTAAMWKYEPEPLDGLETVLFGLLLAVLAPMGELFGSWLAPRAGAPAPALRRIDSWLLATPAFLVGLWIINTTPGSP